MDFDKLKEPFNADDIEWRIAERGTGKNGQWAKVLAYITNRAIMDRLDDVCGPFGWKNEFLHLQGAFLCGLSIKAGDEWITKWDGAQESNIEATKGGISGAMKRAAVQWGIGRYLYNLDVGWAKISPTGANYAGKDSKKNLDAMKWDAPDLPPWALPSGSVTRQSTPTSQPAKPAATSGLISEAQGKRLFAICKNSGTTVAQCANKYGFKKLGEIKKADYQKICDWAEAGQKEDMVQEVFNSDDDDGIPF